MDVLSRDLSLRFWNFFNKDPRHWLPAGVGVTFSIKGTITNPESHAHLAFLDVVAVSLDMADAMGIQFTTPFPQVHNTVYWEGAWTFNTVESKIPAFAANVTVEVSQITSPVNMERCIREVFEEHTVLWKKMTMINRKNDYSDNLSWSFC